MTILKRMTRLKQLEQWIAELVPDNLSRQQLARLVQYARNVCFDTHLAYRSGAESINSLCHALEMELELIEDKLSRHEEIVLNARFIVRHYLTGGHEKDFDPAKLSSTQRYFLKKVSSEH